MEPKQLGVYDEIGQMGPNLPAPKQDKIYFAGKIAGFKDKAERAFEQKHLKSFLAGHERFTHGRDKERKPIWHQVLRSKTKVLI